MEGYEVWGSGVSATAETVTLTFSCERCWDRGSIEKPWVRMGKMTITKTVRCPACNRADDK